MRRSTRHRINFVTSGTAYVNVLASIISPITEHMSPDQYTITQARLCEDNTWKYEEQGDSLNVFFFVEQAPGNGVFISHGIADKNWRNADAVSSFDYVFVSGPLWADKLVRQGMDREKIYIAGYTKLDPIFQGKIQRREREKSTVLWAPTHDSIREVSTYGRFEEYLPEIERLYDVETAVHPYNDEAEITMQSLVDADAVIADSGSILYEAWALGKPVVFPDWLVKDAVTSLWPGSFEDLIYRQRIGYHARDIVELISMLGSAIKLGMTPAAGELIEGIFPTKLRGTSGHVTSSILLRLCEVVT